MSYLSTKAIKCHLNIHQAISHLSTKHMSNLILTSLPVRLLQLNRELNILSMYHFNKVNQS